MVSDHNQLFFLEDMMHDAQYETDVVPISLRLAVLLLLAKPPVQQAAPSAKARLHMVLLSSIPILYSVL